MPRQPTRATLFVIGEGLLAAAVFAVALVHWSWTGAWPFLFLLALSAATGALKITLPGVQGNLSVCYVFLMWSIVNMSLGETLLIGCLSVLVQSFWRCKKKPAFIQLFFNISVITLSIGVGSLAYKARVLEDLVPGHIARILVAAAAYFAWNTTSISVIIALTERLSPWTVWRKTFLWSFPYYLLGASGVCVVDYARKAIGLEVAFLILPAAYLVYQTFVMHVARINQALEVAEREKRHLAETASLHLRTIRALALAIEAKDETTGEHLHRVQTYAVELGRDLGLASEEMEALRAAAILHDVGKLAIPEYIISKPARLTPEEFAKMKVHTIVGAEIVESVNFPYAVAPLVRSHHEKWDGSGYPDGLEGEDIPLGARILSAVDCLDALASDRQYRKAMPLNQAMAIVAAESGKSFDPKVVAMLGARCSELEQLAKSTLQDLAKLSIDATVHLGHAPDAGYAAGSQESEAKSSLTLDELKQEASILPLIISRIGQSASIEDDLVAIQPRLRRLIPFDCQALYRREGDRLECHFASGEGAHLLSGLSIANGIGVSGWTVANRTPLANGNAATEFGVVGAVPPGFSLVSGLSIPLESERGPIGALTLYSRQSDAFQARHLRVLLAVSSRLAYQVNLDFLGVPRAIPATLRADKSDETQILRLLEAIDSESANSPDLLSHRA